MILPILPSNDLSNLYTIVIQVCCGLTVTRRSVNRTFKSPFTVSDGVWRDMFVVLSPWEEILSWKWWLRRWSISRHSMEVKFLPECFKGIRKISKSCPSVRMEQFGSHWTDFYEIWFLSILENLERIQVSFKIWY